VGYDLHRLMILPMLWDWQPNGYGLIQYSNNTLFPGWPGSMWASAILETEREKQDWKQKESGASSQSSDMTACGARVQEL